MLFCPFFGQRTIRLPMSDHFLVFRNLPDFSRFWRKWSQDFPKSTESRFSTKTRVPPWDRSKIEDCRSFLIGFFLFSVEIVLKSGFFRRFPAFSILPWLPLEKTIIDEKAIENEELLDVHFFPKWHFIRALMVRYRAGGDIY